MSKCFVLPRDMDIFLFASANEYELVGGSLKRNFGKLFKTRNNVKFFLNDLKYITMQSFIE